MVFNMCFPKSSGVGNALQRSTSEEKKKNMEIDRLIRRDKKLQSRQVKILLLGAGESGKSTILKQMRIIYSEGFHLDERKEVRQVIFSNMIVAFKIIAEEMREIGMDYENQESHEAERVIAAAEDIGADDSFPPQCLPAMKTLWRDPSVQATIKRGNEYALHDNIQYYYSSIDRLFAKDYLPDDQDVLRSRLRTTGITETLFELGQLKYHMFDVGGQRSERKKWVHCFEGVHCLMFVAALSGYDQCLVEDKTANQMQEALLLFESIMSLTWFKKSSIILFLNKIDLFKAKLAEKPIKDYFPDYAGANDDYNAASQYFANKFRALNRTEDREIYVHFTNATDTNLLKITMQSVQDTIIQANLNVLAAKQQSSKHQRKHSSSKASSSSKDEARPLTAASETRSNGTPSVPPVAKRSGGRRNTRTASKPATARARLDAHPNIPSVPSTQHLGPRDVHAASFFSSHRPISVTTSFPPAFSEAAFSSIFEPKALPRTRPADVIHTLSSAIDSLENVTFSDQMTDTDASYHQSKPSRRSNVKNMKYLDGNDPRVQQVTMDIGDLSRSFRHFVPPPPPVPLDEARSKPPSLPKRRNASASIKERVYSTTLTITEHTLPSGHKTYQASVSPIRSTSSRQIARANAASESALSQPLSSDEVTMVDITPPPSTAPPGSPRQPFRERMRKRQQVWEDGLTGKKREIWRSISVKRQRKLKMKKHKYKKLMRKTRNLRRRLDKN
ncbi:MAG: hypothetical protein Q9219_000768 [cf. Caloplaca sp. 3 TL-2023]